MENKHIIIELLKSISALVYNLNMDLIQTARFDELRSLIDDPEKCIDEENINVVINLVSDFISTYTFKKETLREEFEREFHEDFG